MCRHVHIRPKGQRVIEGEIPGALVVDRVAVRAVIQRQLAIATNHDLRVIVLCSEGYTSSSRPQLYRISDSGARQMCLMDFMHGNHRVCRLCGRSALPVAIGERNGIFERKPGCVRIQGISCLCSPLSRARVRGFTVVPQHGGPLLFRFLTKQSLP